MRSYHLIYVLIGLMVFGTIVSLPNQNSTLAHNHYRTNIIHEIPKT